jgi:hypothetical protein
MFFFMTTTTSSEPKKIPQNNPNTPLKKYPSWSDIKPSSPRNSHQNRKCSNEDKPRKDDERKSDAVTTVKGIEQYKAYKKLKKLNEKKSKQNQK